MDTILSLTGVSKHFGRLCVADDIHMNVAEKEIVAIVGPNGAGKTTLLNIITGHLRVDDGSIRIGGVDVTNWRQHRIAQLGVARTFQQSALFPDLSVRDTLRLGCLPSKGPMMPMFNSRRRRQQTEQALTCAFEALPGWADRVDTKTEALSYGEQREIEIALALSMAPVLLILDEPTAGMSEAETKRFTELVERLRGSLAILIIEHDMDVVRQIADRIVVLNGGAVALEGATEEVLASPLLEEIYFGD